MGSLKLVLSFLTLSPHLDIDVHSYKCVTNICCHKRDSSQLITGCWILPCPLIFEEFLELSHPFSFAFCFSVQHAVMSCHWYASSWAADTGLLSCGNAHKYYYSYPYSDHSWCGWPVTTLIMQKQPVFSLVVLFVFLAYIKGSVLIWDSFITSLKNLVVLSYFTLHILRYIYIHTLYRHILVNKLSGHRPFLQYVI